MVSATRRVWMLVEHRDMELCTSDPGREADVVVVAKSEATRSPVPLNPGPERGSTIIQEQQCYSRPRTWWPSGGGVPGVGVGWC